MIYALTGAMLGNFLMVKSPIFGMLVRMPARSNHQSRIAVLRYAVRLFGPNRIIQFPAATIIGGTSHAGTRFAQEKPVTGREPVIRQHYGKSIWIRTSRVATALKSRSN